MKILALEFSSDERGIAVLDEQEVRGFAIDRTKRGSRCFELITRVLEEARLSAADIECIAVGLGPGSFGGIRTAIAIAQGWQLARGVKLLGVNSADAIARRINSRDEMHMRRAALPFRGVANIVCDAQRGEVFAARYQIGGEFPQALGGFALLTAGEEQHRRSAGEIFFKADMGPWRLGQDVVLLPDARVLGQMAAARTDFISGNQLEPIYLRRAEFVKAPAPKFSAG
jgi:tRNA threonylcarbamoyl adenosine modification protein YeaZ